MSRSNDVEWGTLLLRATVFVNPEIRPVDPAWWQELTGAPPEEKVTKAQGAVQIHQGPFNGGRLVLDIKPGRIDWVWTVVDSIDKATEGLPSLGPFDKTAASFADLLTVWFAKAPEVSRLAFGAKLFQPASSPEDALSRLAKQLHAVKVDPKNSSDLTYSINRPRQSSSGVPNLKINRLSKWGAGVYQSIQIDLMVGTKDLAKPVPIGAEYGMCLLELDINTMPDPRVSLPRGQLSDIMKELTAFGIGIAAEGDVA